MIDMQGGRRKDSMIAVAALPVSMPAGEAMMEGGGAGYEEVG